jgi:hypothetical protein
MAHPSEHTPVTSDFKPLLEPPKSFNPLQATNEELISYGFPPRPNKSTPKLLAVWERTMARPMKFLTPTGESGYKALESPPPKTVPATGPKPEITFATGGSANVQVQLAGANTISAGWIIPYATPPPSAWTGSRYSDGKWSLAVYISIDGTLLAGTTSIVMVSNGQLSHSALAYIGWQTNGGELGQKFLLQSFPVNPLDTMTCSLCSFNSKTSGIASFMNVSTGTPYTTSIDVGSWGGELTNEFGDWGVFDEKSYAPFMPQFTAVSFFECLVSNGTAEDGIGTSTQTSLVENGNTVAKVLMAGQENFIVYSTQPHI